MFFTVSFLRGFLSACPRSLRAALLDESAEILCMGSHRQCSYRAEPSAAWLHTPRASSLFPRETGRRYAAILETVIRAVSISFRTGSSVSPMRAALSLRA